MDTNDNIGGPLALSVVTSIFTIAKQRNLSIFGIQSFNFDADQVFEYIKCFWQNMSFLDYYMLLQIKHPTDSAQQVYVSLTLADEERIKILNKKVGKKLELIHN